METKSNHGKDDANEYRDDVFSLHEEDQLISTDLHFAGDTYTLDEAVEHIGFGKFQLKLMMVAGLCWMCDSMEVMALAILGPHLLCIWDLSSSQEASITTIVFIGLSCGAPVWGWASDKFGRKKGLYTSAVWMLLFGLISSQSQNYAMILVFRGLVGFGLGGMSQSVTVVVEMMPKKARATGIAVLEMSWALGSVLAALVAIPTMGNSSVTDAKESSSWRLYLFLLNLPIILFLLTAIRMPESPYYLLTTGQYEEATSILQRIASHNNKSLPPGKLARVPVNQERGRVNEMVAPGFRMITAILLLLWFVYQFAYYGIVLLTPSIFQTGIDGCNPYESAPPVNTTCKMLRKDDFIKFAWISCAEIPGPLITLLILAYTGRKTTIAILSGFSAVCFAILCSCMSSWGRNMMLFITRASCTSVIQVVYIYTSEVYPTSIRATSQGVCNSFARFGAIVTPFVAQVLIHKSFYSVVLLYSALLLLCVIGAFYLPVETKNRVLENKPSTKRLKSDYEEVR